MFRQIFARRKLRFWLFWIDLLSSQGIPSDYLLILVNELGEKEQNINQLKNKKMKITIETMRSTGNSQKQRFCFLKSI